ncbi:MAG: energy-dependent translational throttle protein EttA [Myxococcota bacterium]
MSDHIFTMKGVTKVHPPDKKVVTDLYLSFLPNAKIGMIGVNGTGKSSLLRIIAGEDDSFIGETWLRPGARVGHLAQEPDLGDATTVLEAVEQAVKPIRDLMSEFEAISMKLGEPMDDDSMTKLLDRQGRLQDEIDAVEGWTLDHQLEVAMDALRLPPPEANPKDLSGGERRRVALCRILLERPEILLLDEPTNHLDASSVAWLEGHLQQYQGCVILITHDRYFLDNVVNWILELDYGRAYPFQGNYSEWLVNKEKRLEHEQKEEQSRQRKIASELEWVRSSPKARQAKSKARMTAYETLLSESNKLKRAANEIKIPPGPRLGELVFEVNDVTKAFGDKLLFEHLSFRVPRGAIVGIVGPNGAGKTTLMRMLVGEERPDNGEVRMGDTVRLSYVDQSREDLEGTHNVWKEITGGVDEIDVGGYSVKSRAYVSWFNFRGSDQQKIVQNLSGGERNRVHLAKLLKSGGNVLVLDEPTNDIDVDTLRSLEEALLEYPGCVLLVTHDRWFLDRIATHILAFEGESQVIWFEGSYEDYAADRKKRLGEDADVPKRIKYRKFATG